jgi:hypothetical protein
MCNSFGLFGPVALYAGTLASLLLACEGTGATEPASGPDSLESAVASPVANPTFELPQILSQADCVADAPRLLDKGGALVECTAEELACRDKCMAGEAAYCVGRAYALEKAGGEDAETAFLYHRGCELGLANACTNYGAYLWSHHESGPPMACAKLTFEKACYADDAFACGMLGRLILENPQGLRDVGKGQLRLEDSCDKLGGFPCRVLAKHLEAGQLGKYDPARISELLARACQGGDPDACGSPKTVAQTFGE